MGKSKKRRSGAGQKHDPIGNGVAAMGDSNEDVETGSEIQTIENIIQQLQSGSSQNRAMGCHSLSTLIDDSAVRQSILDQKLVRLVAPFLVDADKLVKHAAAGVLRNLSRAGLDCAEEMVNQDVMTPLAALLSTYTQGWVPDKVDKEGRSQDTKTETLAESLNLLWNLVEASPTALKIFNDLGLIEFILEHADPSKHPTIIALPSLQCLTAACEDNPPAVEAVRKNGQKIMEVMAQATSMQAKVVAASVAVEICDGSIYDSPSFPAIMSTLKQSLETDSRKLVSDFSSLCPMEEEGMETEGVSGMYRSLETCEDSLQAQQMALEILANLASGNEEEDWLEEESGEDEDDVEEAMDSQETVVCMANPALVEVVVNGGFIQLILNRANSLPENVLQILKESRQGRHMATQHETLQIRSFLCLSNLAACLSIDDFGGIDCLYSTWTSLGTLCFKPDNPQVSSSLLEAATSAMRSLTTKLCEAQSSHKLASFTKQDLQAIIDTAAVSQISNVRTNVVHIVGDIALLASKNIKEKSSEEIVSIVGLWLVESGARDPDLRVLSEALDKLFDIFGEDDTDETFSNIKLLPKLKQILPSMKVKMNQQKKSLGESYSMVVMARTNLQRFIKYKEKRISKIKVTNGH